MGKTFLTIFFIGLFVLAFSLPALAQYGCQPIYGGGEICPTPPKILINKMVKNPQSGTFVDNLGVLDPKFSPDQEIRFRLTVQNTGSDKLSQIEVKDFLPDYLTFVSGPGSYDSSTKTLTFDVSDLGVDESRDFEIVAKVFPSNQIPDDKTTICLTNLGQAKTGDRTDKDTAQFCLEKKVLGAAVQPITGPGNWTLIFLTTFIFGLIGRFFLKHKHAI